MWKGKLKGSMGDHGNQTVKTLNVYFINLILLGLQLKSEIIIM